MINLHLHITHHDTLHGTIFDALQLIKIKPDKVIALDDSAQEHYSHMMDSGDELITYVPPFEVFTSHPGIGTSKTRIVTDGIGIHSTPQHFNLLSELLAHLFKEPPTHLSYIQYIPQGLASIMGPEAFQWLLETNNELLTHGATIPMKAFPAEVLNMTISVNMNEHKGKLLSIRNILLTTSWCSQVEHTETEGHILIVMTHSQVSTACDWIDTSIPTIFKKFLPKNPAFKEYLDCPIPMCMDKVKTTSTVTNYAEALKAKFQSGHETTTKKSSTRFSKPPQWPHYTQAQFTFNSTKFPALPTKTSNVQQHNNSNNSSNNKSSSSTMNTLATNSTTYPNNTNPEPTPQRVDLDA